MPWSPAACRDLGIELSRAVRRRFVPPAKVIALDCDGTLWRGVVGEDGPTGVGVGADGHDRAFDVLQRRVLGLKARGVLLALVSRNEEADVWQVFEGHPGMVLRREDIAAWRIAWRPKSELLTELASSMGFSLDAFVFVDDDRAVRSEVEANAPAVTVLPLPDEPSDRPGALAALWSFDGAGATAVDLARTQLVQEEQQREQARQGATDMSTYLRDLGLVVSIHRATDEELPRLAQLTQRTNQFNVSLRRRTLEEVTALARTAAVLSLTARDRFGDYGLVGMAIVAADGGEPTLDTFLMSCRALGRGVEQTLLHAVGTVATGGSGALADDPGQTRIRAPWVDGPRNAPAIDFLRESGFRDLEPGVLAVEVNGGFAVPSHIALEMDEAALRASLTPVAAIAR
jgi:FkbH-like protein